MIKRFNFLISLCLISIVAVSQNRALGTWKMYLAYHNSSKICDAGDRVYCASPKSIFSCDKSSGAITIYDKASGLSDVGVQTISYDVSDKFLAIAYQNSNMDFIYNNTDIYNIPDIQNSAVTGSVSIYSISFNNGKAYVSSDLGISVVDLQKLEISETYVIGPNGGQLTVYATSFDAQYIYAATAQGLRYASLNANNLQDFNSWNNFPGLSGSAISLVQTYNDSLYAVAPGGNNGDTLYKYNGHVWTAIFDSFENSINSLEVVNGNLYFTVLDDSLGTHGRNCKIDINGMLTAHFTQGHLRPNSWFESNNISWEGDGYNGLYKNFQGSYENIVPDGPFSANVFGLEIKNDVVNVASGGADGSWGYRFNPDGFFIYQNNSWKSYNLYTQALMNNVTDILCAATVSSRNRTYFGSFESGLVEMDNTSGNILNVYNQSNSIIVPNRGDLARTWVTALAVDRDDNLFIANDGTPTPIKVIRNNGAWDSIQIPYSFELVKKMIVDENHQLWAPLRPAGVLVWSYGSDLDNKGDDTSTVLTTTPGQGGLPDDGVNCVVEDNTGNIWLGTNSGIAIIYCPGNIFQGGCDASQIKVTLNGYVGYLFGMQSVQAMAVDAANRIWVGTLEGVWLISNDGQTTYFNFNTSNSPLPSNQITDIAINQITGEVFIGTTGGLVSYQGDAVDTCIGCKEALVYPNPVKPDYTGPIAIKGLADNAYVKITDVSGTLVYQGRANGTQMIWDGNGYKGARAKSGVYMVFSSTDNGKERRVAKILIMN